jgi:hypothetical protein
MADLNAKPIAVHPRCDGRRLLFDIVDDGRHVACAISLMALEDLSESRCYRPADQLKSFALARRQIEIIALGKIQMQAQNASGMLSIWSNDVDDLLSNTESVAVCGRRGLIT